MQDPFCNMFWNLFLYNFNPPMQSTMNSMQILLLLLQLFCFTEMNTSAKPLNGAKTQKKDAKMFKDYQSTSMAKYDYNKTRSHFQKTFLFRKQKWLEQSLETSFKRVREITKRPTATTQCKIFCRNGYHLQILPSGVVKGTVDQKSKYGKLNTVIMTTKSITPRKL